MGKLIIYNHFVYNFMSKLVECNGTSQEILLISSGSIWTVYVGYSFLPLFILLSLYLSWLIVCITCVACSQYMNTLTYLSSEAFSSIPPELVPDLQKMVSANEAFRPTALDFTGM